MIMLDGTIYEGEFQSGKMHGQGNLFKLTDIANMQKGEFMYGVFVQP